MATELQIDQPKAGAKWIERGHDTFIRYEVLNIYDSDVTQVRGLQARLRDFLMAQEFCPEISRVFAADQAEYARELRADIRESMKF